MKGPRLPVLQWLIALSVQHGVHTKSDCCNLPGGGTNRRQQVSMTFLTGKNCHKFFLCTWTSGLWILSSTLYQLSHPVTPYLSYGIQTWHGVIYVYAHVDARPQWQIQRWISSTTKQAKSIKLATTVGHFYMTLTLKTCIWLDYLCGFVCLLCFLKDNPRNVLYYLAWSLCNDQC